MVKIEFNELEKLRQELRYKKIVFCSGSFDLTHVGHLLFLEDCKKQGDILVVSIGSDKLLKKYKDDSRPILNEFIRLKTIDSFKPVDYTFIEPFFDSENHQIGLDKTFEKLHPEVYVINEDASNQDYRKDLCKKYEIQLIILPRSCPPEFEDISTTKIIEKIKSLN